MGNVKKKVVVVTGISIISCLGNTKQTWEGIIQGKSGIRMHQPFSCFPPLPLGMINPKPTPIEDLTVSLIEQLCQDALLSIPQKEIAVVIGSSRGCQSNWELFLRQSIHPSNWLNTLPCQPAIITAKYLQSEGAVLSPANACATGLVAIAQGYELIQQNICDKVVVGGLDSAITPLTIAGFIQMKAMSGRGCYPFAKKRDGFVLAEGGAMLLLESLEEAEKRGAKIYGRIYSWGISCDAQQLTAPAADGITATRMIEDCLRRSGISPSDIDYIHAHGTGTVLNDEREAKIIQSLFPHSFVSSTKCYTGHTLGGAGAITTALNFLALQKQLLLPQTAEMELEFPLNFVTQPRLLPLRIMLSLAFGFGGQNAVVVMGRL
ncbi:MAG: beta-ketoacyl-ACP synthase [Geminocystis sp.]|nr:beta-ketoacyl-ACP synthase [Geminocystis sp.]MCS7146893.1 beta-ketoacyl-ACP synthase [Geminocystis sp.]MCX8078913.1 beta-ketoacyl-ACP synthase [Geminocystis sp.]MDW8115718.1 beta-ketoacyl-ACP synthase [Geminocystis sp.]MDW8463261.1 beta-ketoacyl-ACP synthase [Geminocystis sp.]